jgi:hypothetical protein
MARLLSPANTPSSRAAGFDGGPNHETYDYDQGGLTMKKTYEKPTLVRRDLLNRIAGGTIKIPSGSTDD